MSGIHTPPAELVLQRFIALQPKMASDLWRLVELGQSDDEILRIFRETGCSSDLIGYAQLCLDAIRVELVLSSLQ